MSRIGTSQSVFHLGVGDSRLYIRYSKVHERNRTFFGLRQLDLRELEGRPAFICFLWDGQAEPLIVPFCEYEEVFQSTRPAPDGQFKAQVFIQPEGTDLYIAGAGRFNVDDHFGWDVVGAIASAVPGGSPPNLSHCQVQSLLGAIGVTKGFDVWVPLKDRSQLDWLVTEQFVCRAEIGDGYEQVAGILDEVDVLWIKRGSTELTALFEIEHSTPVYSGLLRFNDVRLAAPTLNPRFTIVANENRRSLFVRQLRRPTFRASGLSEACTFLEYANVYGWHERVLRSNS